MKILFIFLISFNIFSVCKKDEIKFLDKNGLIKCERSNKRLKVLSTGCFKENKFEACLLLSKNLIKGNKKVAAINKHKEIITEECINKKKAPFCARAAGLLENMHANKEIIDLPVKEVKRREILWALACEYSEESQKDGFFCVQKDFIMRYYKDLEKKCRFKFEESCSKLSIIKKRYGKY